MRLSRRKFLKLGAASSALIALEGKFQVLSKAVAEEFDFGGRDVSQKGETRQAIPSTCLMCGVTDGIIGYVENGRLVKIEGNPKHPNTRSHICAKGQSGIQFLYDPFRIKWPMKRVGKRGENKWKRISRDEALDEVANRIKDILKEGEPGKIAVHHGRDRDSSGIRGRFQKAIGTKHTFNHTSVCESSLKVGYETSYGQDIDTSDCAHAHYQIHWGDNINEASYMMNPMSQRIVEGKADNGAKMVGVDSRLSNTAAYADEWISVKPGTDAAVILAMCNVIMEEGKADTDWIDQWANYSSSKLKAYLKKFTPEWAEGISEVPASDIKRIALEFAEQAPRCYARAYNGLSNHVNGAMNARCLALLNALVGNFDMKGGFCMVKGGGLGSWEPEPPKPEKGEFPLSEKMEEEYPLASHEAWHLVPTYIKDLNYKFKLYLLHMYNPLFINPEQELWREVFMDPNRIEYIVDFSPFWSETAVDAVDLIIPETTYLERLCPTAMPPVENFPYLGLYQPVVQPLYESASIYDYYIEIAKRVGKPMAEYFNFTMEEQVKAVVEQEWGTGSYERLKKDGALIPNQPDGTYKSYDELTPEELDKMRVFESYAKKLSSKDIAEMKSKGFKFPAGDGPIKDDKGEKTQGVIIKGVAYQGFPTESGKFQIFAQNWKDHGFDALPNYNPIPHIKNLGSDDFILTTGKINVHCHSRTEGTPWLMELCHYNPAWINAKRAEELGIEENDEITVESDYGVRKIKCRAHLTEGIHPQAIWVTAHFGHWAWGELASKGKYPKTMVSHSNTPKNPAEAIDYKPGKVPGEKLEDTWWVERNWPGKAINKDHRGRTVVGYSPNSIMSSGREFTDLGGEYAWCDTPVKVRKA